MSETKLTFEEIIIEGLRQGTAPFLKPWTPGKYYLPINLATGKPYQGINSLMLSIPDYADPRWGTLKQGNDKNLRVRKGEKSLPVVFWQWEKKVPVLDAQGSPVLDAEGNPVKEIVQLERPLMRRSAVFNASQFNGELPPFDSSEPAWDRHERAAAILAGSGAVIKHDQRNRAFYRGSDGSIHLPPLSNFETADKYYATALHELMHWTGHPDRMNRDFKGPFGSEEYAREELRAEIASWMIGLELGIGHDPSQHLSYVGSWIKVLEKDQYEIVRACRDAEKMKEYVLSMEHKKELNQEVLAPVQDVPTGPWLDGARKVVYATPTVTVGKHEWRCIVFPVMEVMRSEKTENGLEFHKGTMNVTDWEWRNPGETTWRGSKDWRTYDNHRGDDGLPKSLKNIWDKYKQEIQAAKEGKQLEEHSRSLLNTSVIAKEKTFLHVPFKEKDQARAAGAKWDAMTKLWFAPEGADLTKLQAWRTAKTPEPVQSMDPQQEFAEALGAAGLDLGGHLPTMDGKIHRVQTVDGKPGSLDGAYVGHLDGYPAGWYQNHKTGQKAKWMSTGHTLTEEQKKALKIESAERARHLENVLRVQRDRVARECAQSFSTRHLASSDHPYLALKGILPLGDIKESRSGNTLLVPLFNAAGELRNVQEITPKGEKYFQSGGEKKGCFLLIDSQKKVEQGEILVAEGYATGVSLHLATGLPVGVAFDAGNLEPVADIFRQKFPEAKIAICADNDHKREHNIGVEKAVAAARNIAGCVVVPDFTSDEMQQGLTDFNDLHQARGLEAVKDQVTRTLEIKKYGMNL